MDRLVDLVTSLFQETRLYHPLSGSKNYIYTAIGVILMLVINLAAQFLSAFYGSWISTLCMALTVVVLAAEFAIPLIAHLINHNHTRNPRPASRRHPLEEHTVAFRRFRVVGKTDQTARKPISPYQKKRKA